MKLKDKNTGKVGEYLLTNQKENKVAVVPNGKSPSEGSIFNTLAELYERFEDPLEEIKPFEEDRNSFKSGNAFWTKEEADKEAARRKAYVILKEDMKRSNPDCKDLSKRKYTVCYDNDFKRLTVVYFVCSKVSELMFATEADAEASIKAHEKGWRVWLGVEDE